MKIECSDHMGKFILGVLKMYAQDTDADLYDEACEMVKKAEAREKPLLCADLSFTYRGQKFELENMVPLTNQRLRDKTFVPLTFGGFLSDKYALFAVHNDVAEDKPNACPEVTQVFLECWFGSEDDLKPDEPVPQPGEPVPQHVLDEIDRRWDEVQRTLYGNEAK